MSRHFSFLVAEIVVGSCYFFCCLLLHVNVNGFAFSPSYRTQYTGDSRNLFQSLVERRYPFRVPSSSAAVTNPASESLRMSPIMSLSLKFGEPSSSRTALVTGAGRGIGKAIATKLADGGVKHVICVSRSGCENVAEEVRKKGCEASSYSVDVASGPDVSALCDKLLQDHETIDILVNNAGITKDNLFIRMTEKEWSDVINTNLNSAFYFCNPIVKRMIKKRFGRIINMSSVVGVGGNPGQANYAASKAGVIGFTRSLAKEVASRGITVNAVAPGFINTQMTDAMTPEAKEAAMKSIPAGRMGTVDEIAEVVAFLASDNSSYVTGKVMPVDGGVLFGGN